MATVEQVGGKHYAAVFQHWDLVCDAGMGYFEGQVTKYIARWRKKNGVEDLEKALSYLDKLLALYHEHRIVERQKERLGAVTALRTFFNAQTPALGEEERRIIIGMTRYKSTGELLEVRPLIVALIEKEKK
jgi:hypothetical protein